MPLLLDDQALPAPTPQAAPKAAFIFEADAHNFMASVIDASRERLVIVDFWAPWCAPCKQLGPLLEELVLAHKGAVRLAKVNLDTNQQLAAQLRVQSVPTVFAFFQGQPVDGFTGSIGQAQMKSWLDRLVTATGSKPPEGAESAFLEEDLRRAAAALAAGDIEEAQTLYADILKISPKQAQAFAGQLRCLLAAGQSELAADILAGAQGELRTASELEPIRAAIELTRQTQGKADTLEPLRRAHEADPENPQTLFDLALAHLAGGDPASAIDALLELVRKDRAWQDEAARKQLVKILESLGAENPLTAQSRKRLSSILFS